ncbi:MAG: DUF1707 SHOCT-like domain-containing protein [Mycobacteriales bacterium]
MTSDAGFRASDAERAETAAALERHGAEGRLDPSELTARLDRAAQARTRGELAALLADLPLEASADAPRPRPGAAGLEGERASRPRPHRRSLWPVWAAASLVSWAVWGATVATSSSHGLQGLWPIWVTVPWGAVLLVSQPPWRRSRG